MILTGRNEGTPYVFVFDQSHAVGNPGFLGISQGSIQSGIRNTDDNVRIHRMRLCQNDAGSPSGIMNADPLNDRIRTGKVDMLKDAEFLGSGAAVPLIAMNAAAVNGQDLAGKNIPYDFRTYRMESAAFGSHYIGAVSHLPIAQWTETMGIPDGDQLRGGHQNQRVGSV